MHFVVVAMAIYKPRMRINGMQLAGDIHGEGPSKGIESNARLCSFATHNATSLIKSTIVTQLLKETGYFIIDLEVMIVAMQRQC